MNGQTMHYLRGQLQLELGNFKLESGAFNLPMQGVTVLFGRSGSGKSTLLRAISGLDKNTRGELFFGDVLWQSGKKSLPTQQRHIGFVFQDAALFPHMTVRQNLLYGVKRLPKGIEAADFDEIVARVGIADKLDRGVNFLSGGEKQRVAIARALLLRPQILCMDEPLSALDWRSKAEMLTLIEELVAAYRIPVLYITHAPAEVERLAQNIVFMDKGRIERVETLQEALSRVDSPLFDDEGAVSVLHGLVGQEENGLYPIALGENRLWLSERALTEKQSARVRVLAKDVSLSLSDPQQLSIINHLPGTILELIPEQKQRVLVRLQLGDGQKLFAEITRFSSERLGLQVGQTVYALIKTVALTE
ncbi:molybdenum ABC transporter ATP-binding protein [Thiomicrorhabdus sp.]|uniref:molybdenum ABC transporter ATP-binding protein n=1 Tax=Thiomicrorhabdus sp. TaxID=2039724 RepID=UPI0029C74942|nr:molybdenum ABC transporter ATP-binding protein [Thiomicrorhabdus sp.]